MKKLTKKDTKRKSRNLIRVDWRRIPQRRRSYTRVGRDLIDYDASDYEITDYDLAMGPWK